MYRNFARKTFNANIFPNMPYFSKSFPNQFSDTTIIKIYEHQTTNKLPIFKKYEKATMLEVQLDEKQNFFMTNNVQIVPYYCKINNEFIKDKHNFIKLCSLKNNIVIKICTFSDSFTSIIRSRIKKKY